MIHSSMHVYCLFHCYSGQYIYFSLAVLALVKMNLLLSKYIRQSYLVLFIQSSPHWSVCTWPVAANPGICAGTSTFWHYLQNHHCLLQKGCFEESKCWTYSSNFRQGNRKNSHGVRSGLNGGCSTYSMFC